MEKKQKKTATKKTLTGILPERIWKEQRFFDILSAMHRYIDAKEQIPSEWVREFRALEKGFSKHRRLQNGQSVELKKFGKGKIVALLKFPMVKIKLEHKGKLVEISEWEVLYG